MRKGFLDLRRLRYFQAIVRLGSLSAAAREMNIAQPALSHHIAEIERDLGAPVLVRHQSGVRPTELGTRLSSHAAEILDRVAEAEHDLLASARRDVPLQTIHLAIIPSLASALTAELISGFADVLPTVDLHLIEARTGYCGALIESGKADIAIQLVNPDEVESEPLIWETLYWVTLRKDRPNSGPVRLAEILQTPLILPSPGNPLRRCLQAEADANGLRLHVAREVDGPDPRRQAVLAGLGTTVFGAHSVAAGLLGPLLMAHPIVDPVLTRPIVMMVRKDFNMATAEVIRTTLKRILAAAPQVHSQA
jgi:LysR family transcriptional regulator, nitrogen assimilation regulatory protein